MSTMIRSLVAALIVGGIYAGTRVLDGGGIPTKGTSPQQDLEDLPLRLGRWEAEDLGMSPELSHTVSVLDRRYKSVGREVCVHATVSVFSNDWKLPHLPLRCYKSSGHTLLERKIVKVDLPGGGEIPALLMTVEREKQRSYVLYWYNVGNQIVHDRPQQRRIAWTMRGKEAWPPVLKVMLTNADPDERQAVAQLKSVAGPLAEWAVEFR